MATILMTAEDGELPCRPEHRAEFVAARRLFELDSYFPAIASLTFATEFASISAVEAAAWQRFNRGAELDAAASAAFTQLRSKLAAAMARFGEAGCFVRLSTRSPKDAVDKLPARLQPLLRNALTAAATAKHCLPAQLDVNDLYLALRQAFFEALHVHTAEEVLEIVAHSSRSVSDLRMALANTDVATEWSLGLVVREWITLPLGGELRGFCCGGKLTALSQYYCDVYFSWLDENAEETVSQVRHFFEHSVATLLPTPDCVIDFVVWPDGRIRIVELNPLTPSTGACLFSWTTDKAILHNGPFEFRRLRAPPPHQVAQLSPWRGILDTALQSLQPPSSEPPPAADAQSDRPQFCAII